MRTSPPKRHCFLLSSERGASLIELFVSIAISSVVFLGISRSFFDTSRRAWDHTVITSTNEQARALLDMMAWDLRMVGSGMPLGQASFTTNNLGLGDAPVPILPSSTATSVTFRLNQTGRHTVLTSTYAPSSTNLSFTVLDASDIDEGDTIYISDMSRGGAQGVKATVTGVSGSTVNVGSNYITSTGSAFTAGSTVNVISNVTYTSNFDWSGITREDEDSLQVVLPNSRFFIRYFNEAGVEMPLPLTVPDIENQLSSVLLTLEVRSMRALRDGNLFTASVQKRIALRNLNFNR